MPYLLSSYCRVTEVFKTFRHKHRQAARGNVSHHLANFSLKSSFNGNPTPRSPRADRLSSAVARPLSAKSSRLHPRAMA
ncbi:hypothetical protein QOZ96_003469 [Brevundimonas nasdae]|uniref:hypothetical protein n=1 Tax=Brevundimonas nasdae TaxID=172043 RepID=UPI001913F39B|nr:hypothetical protein [Brevundimonas nasdae]MBK6026755.1 hypothetical protein [Brevundimonas nasdae]MDQ0453496.1 hypothetical protein [Brevundimonas nasdae]